MKTVSFYPNDPDDMHCCVSVYRMLFRHFLKRDIPQDEMDEFVGFKSGRAAWTLLPNAKMVREGFDIKMIEPFDYAQYSKRGDTFLDEVFSPEKAAWIRAHSNISDIVPYIPELLSTVSFECRQATLEDLDQMLDDGRLVLVTLNSRALNGKSGYIEHVVLVIRQDNGNYIVHDPGLPPIENRAVTRDLLWHAMGGDSSTSEVTGFCVRTPHHPPKASV